MKLSHAIGFVMSRILLTVLWIVGFGLYGIVLKITGLFQKKIQPSTYWISSPAQTTEDMKRQF